MPHSHPHQHGGGSYGSPQNFGRAFAICIALNLVYVMLEAAFGLYSGSLAPVADAGHNLSDVVGLVLAGGAVWLGKKPPQGRQTFGYEPSRVRHATLQLEMPATADACPLRSSGTV